MFAIPVPYQGLHVFRENIGLDDHKLGQLDPFRVIFSSKQKEFAGYLYDVFASIPETGMILEREERPGLLLDAWKQWFDRLFQGKLDDGFLSYLAFRETRKT